MRLTLRRGSSRIPRDLSALGRRSNHRLGRCRSTGTGNEASCGGTWHSTWGVRKLVAAEALEHRELGGFLVYRPELNWASTLSSSAFSTWPSLGGSLGSFCRPPPLLPSSSL
ncbi:hypothetical protein V6Z11_A08G159900 [Gossypium hirsutum]